MTLKFTHPLFGHNRPEFTSHFYQRYAERIFGIAESGSKAWAKFNGNKIIQDFYGRFPKCEILLDMHKQEYYEQKYGKDLRFLKHNRYIFVVRDFRRIVTVYKID